MDLLYPRHLSRKITESMHDTPATMIIGPRQCGKTTLTEQFSQDMSYVSLDDESLRNAAKSDPVGFIRRFDRIAIDEVQHAPGLLPAIKLSIDRDRRPGRFLLTGSANLLTLPRVSESLAGRMEILTLLPLSNAEIERRDNYFLESAVTQSWPAYSTDHTTKIGYSGRILKGGYPEMLMRPKAGRRTAWADAYLRALMEFDVRDLDKIEKLDEMPRLLNVLAQCSGQLVNFTQIGGQLNLNAKTTQKYTGMLENLFLVKTIFPWSRNTLGRLVKTPKLHFVDAGLQSTLIRLTDDRVLTDRSAFGAVMETWVYGELAKAVSIAEETWQIFHYRDKDQVEVDFVLERQDRGIIGIEVKAAASVSEKDFKGLKKLCQLSGDHWISGIVIYDGDQVLPFGKGFWAVPCAML